MEPIVISYYPGAGGFRLAYYLYDKIWNRKPGQHYHCADAGCSPPERMRNYKLNSNAGGHFLTVNSPVIESSYPIELSHCLNSEILRRCFPNRKIIKIKSPLLPALARYWQVFGCQNPTVVNKIIKTQFYTENYNTGLFYFILQQAHYEYEYYTQTPVDWMADQLFDIELGQDEFCQFMRDEYLHSQSLEALDAWAILRRTKYTNFNL